MGRFFNRFIPPAPEAVAAISAVSLTYSTKASRVVQAISRQFGIIQSLGTKCDFEYYIAKDNLTGSTVRIKALSEEAACHEQRRTMFRMESSAASSLSQINIVESGNAREIDGTLLCVQEYKDDTQTLREVLKKEGWFDTAQAIDIADEIASAIDYAHQQGVLHLNLNPEKILVESNGLVYINEFGIEQSDEARWARSERSRRQTAAYLSPQQVTGEDPDYRSDLYSLGLLVFEMLADRVPFDRDDLMYTADHRARHLIPPPHFFRPGIPAAVSEVVLKMLSKKPVDRYANASEFLSALRDADQDAARSVTDVY